MPNRIPDVARGHGGHGGHTAAPHAADPSQDGGQGPTVDRLILEDNRAAQVLFGERNVNLRRLERDSGAQVHSRGNEVTFMGSSEAVTTARRVTEELYALAEGGRAVTPDDITRAAAVVRGAARAGDPSGTPVRDVMNDTILVASRARPIAPKGIAQKRYVDAIRERDIVFGIGPAGTGKTYLAMALAVRELMEKRVKRIVLTRPAVEAGERLGFLPGSMEDKVSPYLRPLYDALHDMMDFEKADQLVSRGLIEIAPIAFMRGRTLNDSFVILDEAQNTTGEQMKMFLTRLGFESKAVITGDITQIDLADNRRSGLREAERVLAGIPGIEFCYFTEVDVVRHPLVQEVIKAYDRFERSKAERRESARSAEPRADSEPTPAPAPPTNESLPPETI